MEVCPAGIDIYNLMMEARRNKQLPESFEMSIKNILDTGYSMPMRGIASIREMYGLSPLEHPSSKIIGTLLKEVKDKLKKA
ncbi:hypothetical protein IPdc08_01908 [archaeon]|nr:hypothetical protein IPdc08_01908 [archaeon]